uniref:Uncharacterized protein n=1 Tax=Oryza barthii TaxID=65489 RepID=A0A0D3G748_9ORYZ
MASFGEGLAISMFEDVQEEVYPGQSIKRTCIRQPWICIRRWHDTIITIEVHAVWEGPSLVKGEVLGILTQKKF